MDGREKPGPQERKLPFLRVFAFSRQFRCGQVPGGQTGSNRSSWGSTEAERPPRYHPAGNSCKNFTVNDLQYSRGLSGAKPVKVCQSKAGQSARGQARSRTLRVVRRALDNAPASWSCAMALHRFSRHFIPIAFGLVRESGPMAVKFGSIQDYSGLFNCHREASAVVGGPEIGRQISTGNIGNTVTVLAGKWRQTRN